MTGYPRRQPVGRGFDAETDTGTATATAVATVPAGRWTSAFSAPAALAVLAAACAGCDSSAGPEARKLLVMSSAAYEQGDDQAVLRHAGAFLTDHAATKEADVAYYLRGLAKYRLRDVGGSRADLQAALDRSQRRDVRVGALKALGDLAYEGGDVAAAEGMYSQALKDAEPRKPPEDELRYRLGCILQRRGQWEAADGHFDYVLHVYQATDVARRAEQRLRCRTWTIQAGAYARKALADAEAARLRRGGLAARTGVLRPGSALQFAVHVGMYGTYDQAAAGLGDVRRHRADAFITPVP